MSLISFTVSKEDAALVDKIVDRAHADLKRLNAKTRQDLEMDIIACHANGMPLDLAKLLAAPHGDFGHDIGGIQANIDRRTGKMGPVFLPRCAMPAKKK